MVWLRVTDAHSIFKLVHQLISGDKLFTWLTQAHPEETLPKTTNPLESGVNTAAKELLRKHHGMTPEHAMKAIGWLLYFKTEHPTDPWTLVTPAHWQPTTKTKAKSSQSERIGPADRKRPEQVSNGSTASAWA